MQTVAIDHLSIRKISRISPILSHAPAEGQTLSVRRIGRLDEK
jgi:hypothetical protein